MQCQCDLGTVTAGPGLDQPQLEQAVGLQRREGGIDSSLFLGLAQLEEANYASQRGILPAPIQIAQCRVQLVARKCRGSFLAQQPLDIFIVVPDISQVFGQRVYEQLIMALRSVINGRKFSSIHIAKSTE